ncbi:MAG: hypothetical protein M1831_003502 [Alyxoria varia]|nr:MAG: hypothetical protein M1831_003502 [Alyxoria varia]
MAPTTSGSWQPDKHDGASVASQGTQYSWIDLPLTNSQCQLAVSKTPDNFHLRRLRERRAQRQAASTGRVSGAEAADLTTSSSPSVGTSEAPTPKEATHVEHVIAEGPNKDSVDLSSRRPNLLSAQDPVDCAHTERNHSLDETPLPCRDSSVDVESRHEGGSKAHLESASSRAAGSSNQHAEGASKGRSTSAYAGLPFLRDPEEDGESSTSSHPFLYGSGNRKHMRITRTYSRRHRIRPGGHQPQQVSPSGEMAHKSPIRDVSRDSSQSSEMPRKPRKKRRALSVRSIEHHDPIDISQAPDSPMGFDKENVRQFDLTKMRRALITGQAKMERARMKNTVRNTRAGGTSLAETGDGFEGPERWLPARKSVLRSQTAIFRPSRIKPDIPGPKLQMVPSKELDEHLPAWSNTAGHRSHEAKALTRCKIVPTVEHQLSSFVSPDCIGPDPRGDPTANSDDEDSEDEDTWIPSESQDSASSVHFRRGSGHDVAEDDSLSLIHEDDDQSVSSLTQLRSDIIEEAPFSGLGSHRPTVGTSFDGMYESEGMIGICADSDRHGQAEIAPQIFFMPPTQRADEIVGPLARVMFNMAARPGLSACV